MKSLDRVEWVGTHLVLSRARGAIEPGRKAPFDLMVDDIDEARAEFTSAGVGRALAYTGIPEQLPATVRVTSPGTADCTAPGALPDKSWSRPRARR